MSFHWSCFIVPPHLEICSFITILVCLSLFYSVYEKKKLGKIEKKNVNNCACVCIQYQYSLSTYMDL